MYLNISASQTGFNWNKSPTNITEIPPKSRALPMISCRRLWKNVSIPEPIIDTSSMNIYFTPIICVLSVLSESVSKDLYCNFWFTGIFKAKCRVFPLIRYAAFFSRSHQEDTWFVRVYSRSLFKYLYNNWKSNVVTCVFPTPAPPDKNLHIGSFEVLAWCRTSITNSDCFLFNVLICLRYSSPGITVIVWILSAITWAGKPRSWPISYGSVASLSICRSSSIASWSSVSGATRSHACCRSLYLPIFSTASSSSSPHGSYWQRTSSTISLISKYLLLYDVAVPIRSTVSLRHDVYSINSSLKCFSSSLFYWTGMCAVFGAQTAFYIPHSYQSFFLLRITIINIIIITIILTLWSNRWTICLQVPISRALEFSSVI